MTQAVVNLPTQHTAEASAYAIAKEKAMNLAKSELVPQGFQNKPANCLIALNLANRLEADPLMVMQNLYVVHGKPGWSSQFLIATFNQCGRFSSIRYKFSGEKGSDEWGCYAYACDKETGEEVRGITVTIAMAKAEGWMGKKGSKWQTMPELMMQYRAAAFLIRTTAPEISMGLHTGDELEDMAPQPQEQSTVKLAELANPDAGTNSGADDVQDVQELETLTGETAGAMIQQVMASNDLQSLDKFVADIALDQYAESKLKDRVRAAIDQQKEDLAKPMGLSTDRMTKLAESIEAANTVDALNKLKAQAEPLLAETPDSDQKAAIIRLFESRDADLGSFE